MSFNPGTKLGPYEIIAPLGAGGMGEVFKARDTRLERTVAIKVLPRTLALDPQFKARFEREGKSISALSHPHICTLYDVGEVDGTSYLVMEHLEGETLADRLKKGLIPGDNAIAFAGQIADALDKAHRQGIVHRDLKPANVFLVRAVGASGAAHVKLLDFGLAKTGVAPAAGSFETRLATTPPAATNPLTAEGTILGTFQYMAPEQIEGQEADARADIWAFGCVLYEMLTGRRAFEGKSQASLIASILERQPTPVSELQPLTPPALGRIVRTCLEKNPDNRFHTAHDLWLHLQWIEEGGSAAGLPAPVAARRKRRAQLTTAALVLAAAALTGSAGWWLKPAAEAPRVVTRFIEPLPEDLRFTRTGRRVVAISRDGSKLAYIANQQIYVRALGELEARPVRGTNVDPVELEFSPDGHSLAFFAPVQPGGSLTGSSLKRIAVAGGIPVHLCDADTPYGLRWQGERIIFSLGTRVLSISENGGTPEMLLDLPQDDGERLAQPQLLNGGRDLLVSLRPRGGSFADGRIAIVTLADGNRRILVDGGMDGRILPSGHLVWIRDSTVFAQAIGMSTLQLRAAPVPMLEGVDPAAGSGAGQFSVSDTGTVVYRPQDAVSSGGTLVWVDRAGREEPTGAPLHNYGHVRLSRSGSQAAVHITSGERDLWIWDVARNTLRKLTSGPEMDFAPVWSADDQRIFYTSGLLVGADEAQIYERPANGTGIPVEVGHSPALSVPLMLLNARELLVQGRAAPGQSARAWLWPLGRDERPKLLLSESLPPQVNATVSPDRRWIAYQSHEGSTRDEIHVRPFPDTDNGHWQLSSGGGSRPLWGPSGQELFYESPPPARRIMRVEIETTRDGAFGYGVPTVLFDSNRYRTEWGTTFRAFDVSPDGRRFLLIASPTRSQTDDQKLMVVTNWFEELKARVVR